MSLLRIGRTEKECDAVEGLPSWPTRYSWLADKDFFTRRQEAQKLGVEYQLIAHEERCLHVYDKALDDAANKPLVDLLKEMGNHTRWKASKLNRDTYGEKVATENKNTNLNASVDAETFREAPDALVKELHDVLKKHSR